MLIPDDVRSFQRVISVAVRAEAKQSLDQLIGAPGQSCGRYENYDISCDASPKGSQAFSLVYQAECLRNSTILNAILFMGLSSCDVLGLQACFNNVQWVSYDCSACACRPSAYEIPKQGSLPIPWPDPSFQVLIDAHHGHHERDIHEYCDGIGPI
jgi:hypothetical protein